MGRRQASLGTPLPRMLTTIKSQALANFLVDWTETQYLPPPPDSTHWCMHFDGSKMRLGLGDGIVLSSPKGNRLRYTL